MSSPSKNPNIMITSNDSPVIGFPVDSIQLHIERQIVFVPALTYKGTRFTSGAYVLLEREPTGRYAKDGWCQFAIVNVKLQAHLLEKPFLQAAPANIVPIGIPVTRR